MTRLRNRRITRYYESQFEGSSMRRSTTEFPLRIIAAAALILILGSCGGEEKDEAPVQVVRPVKTMTLGGEQGTGRSFPGKVQGSQRVNLSFRVQGPLIEFPVNEGDEVKAGQLLARLDPKGLSDRSRRSIRAVYRSPGGL